MIRYLVTGLTLLATTLASPAPNDNSLLFFKPVSGSEKDVATANGFTVVELDAAAWSTLTTADVATFKAVVLGDEFCNFGSPAVLAPVESNRAVWSAAVTGNVVIMGTDPSFHRAIGGATTLMDRSLKFAAAEKGKTGLYASLSCYYADAPETTVTWLDQFGDFRVRGKLACYDHVHIVAMHPAIDTLTDADLSNWSCSVHEVIFDFPTNFAPLAIALNMTGSGLRTFVDGSRGVPYIVARGVKVEKCGNGVLDLGEECDDGNLVDGDGCSSTCRKEGPSGGTCEKCIEYPGQNKCHITTSCSPTPYGTMCACRPGYKAKGASSDTSVQWRLKWTLAGHEHRVYVKPGMECNELCAQWYLGAAACAEISIAECKA